MFAVGHFPIVRFPALGDDDIIILLTCDRLDAIDGLGKEIVVDVADDHPDGLAPASFEALGDGVGFVVILLCIGMYLGLCLVTDLVTTVQGLTDRRYGQTEGFGDVFYGDGFELHVFGAIVFVKKICGKGSELYITGL